MGLIGGLEAPVEQVSLDEAYIDLTGIRTPIDFMSGLVRRIEADLGLDASVGIGPQARGEGRLRRREAARLRRPAS